MRRRDYCLLMVGRVGRVLEYIIVIEGAVRTGMGNCKMVFWDYVGTSIGKLGSLIYLSGSEIAGR
jgi:hypothetical protein